MIHFYITNLSYGECIVKIGLYLTVEGYTGYLDPWVKKTSSDTKVQETQKLITMSLDCILIKLLRWCHAV